MPQEESKTARFDHVSGQGNLVFAYGHELFEVCVDNTLDRAILEAKQILEEEHGTPIPQASFALPISAIQAAVRAGETTKQVAQEFAVNEAIVRRFANPIETEKKYAIEQFLSMSAPKRGSGSSNEEAINRSLEAADVSINSVSWNATRRGNGPWKIRASFQAMGHAFQADWTWNMKENNITCVNTIAQQLLEGSQSFLPNTEDTAPPTNPELTAIQAPPAYSEPTVPTPSNTNTQAPVVEISTPPSVPAGTQGTAAEDSTSIDKKSSEQDNTPHTKDAAQLQSNQTDSARMYPVPTTTDMTGAQHTSEPLQEGPSTITQSVIAGDQTDTSIADESTKDNTDQQVDEHPSNPLTAWMYGGKRKTEKNKTVQQRGEQEPSTKAKNSLSKSAEPVSSQKPASKPIEARTNITNDTPSQTPHATTGQNTVGHQQTSQETTSGISSAQKTDSNQEPSPKKAGRSAVPSWDEILFGQ
ncbi:septation protein SepH [Bombiscardovia coagulans]|uniref:DUF3071 domain-containing protein n=1 Tax=Bombiscardovia coagulans TaxID=686666 RepID=A0A261EVX2_9BIFI|nr:septation protein SepH [Bombiscardovia coagulans]OZG50985.1 hypothetical protein BOCO_0171 [Bombiscardovia coagulans]